MSLKAVSYLSASDSHVLQILKSSTLFPVWQTWTFLAVLLETSSWTVQDIPTIRYSSGPLNVKAQTAHLQHRPMRATRSHGSFGYREGEGSLALPSCTFINLNMYRPGSSGMLGLSASNFEFAAYSLPLSTAGRTYRFNQRGLPNAKPSRYFPL